MATEEQIMNTNRLSSLTYMISACLEFSIQNFNYQLDQCNLRLVGRDKMVFNRVRSQIEQLRLRSLPPHTTLPARTAVLR